MTLLLSARWRFSFLVAVGVLALGCKVSKDVLARAAERQVAALDGLASNLAPQLITLRQLDERLTVVTPKARQANLSNVETRIKDARTSTDALLASANALEKAIETQLATSRKLGTTAKMGKDDFAAAQATYAATEKRAQDELVAIGESFTVVDEKVRALERGVINISAGNDEKGKDSDGE